MTFADRASLQFSFDTPVESGLINLKGTAVSGNRTALYAALLQAIALFGPLDVVGRSVL